MPFSQCHILAAEVLGKAYYHKNIYGKTDKTEASGHRAT